ncbi:hypothetical protein HMPREF1567_0907 [Providencia alcalifaciens PAL-2]|nr:hypothetical protein HMPREF1567_0907 [Providencia alcalifaciens PAL-2]
MIIAFSMPQTAERWYSFNPVGYGVAPIKSATFLLISKSDSSVYLFIN